MFANKYFLNKKNVVLVYRPTNSHLTTNSLRYSHLVFTNILTVQLKSCPFLHARLLRSPSESSDIRYVYLTWCDRLTVWSIPYSTHLCHAGRVAAACNKKTPPQYYELEEQLHYNNDTSSLSLLLPPQFYNRSNTTKASHPQTFTTWIAETNK